MRKLTFVLCIASTAALFAQSPTFEVATLKQNNSGERGGGIQRQPGGRMTVKNMPARQLIGFAYQLQPYQLIGGPGWLNDDKFDITAKMEGNPEWGGPGGGTPDPMALALRAFLTERFKLKVHTETRDLDAYALVMVKPGVPGPALVPSPTDCNAMADALRQGKLPPGPPKPVDDIFPCGMQARIGMYTFDGFPISRASGLFTGQAGRPVVDRTGLSGVWRFKLTFAQEQRIAGAPGGEALPPPDPNLPNFFTALQEQLGLKLESTKAPFDVTVIDSAEHPAED